jgi:F-type H+-transporting ATPase subunit a
MFLFSGGTHEPLVVEFVNHYLGEPVLQFELAYTKPLWDKVLGAFGTNATAVFGEYTAENAIPWYTIMFAIACLLSIAVIWIFKGKLNEDDPKHGQLTLEAGFLALREMVVSVIGENGFKHFPVVATFAVMILVSNLMGMFPLFKAPTAHISVTLALGITSFVYYNYIGIKENGLLKYIAHFAGPKLPAWMFLITGLIFIIEIVSSSIRPVTLGLRLFANMFADEQIAEQISGLYPPFTQFLVPVVLMPLGLFVAFVQTFVFTLLSMIYLSLVTHNDHEHHEAHSETHGEPATAHA